VSSLQNKIISFWRKLRNARLFSNWLKSDSFSQESADRKLIYALSPRKIPNGEQIKHLNKFLNPREFLLIKICILIVLVNGVYLGTVFLKKHLQYLPVIGGEYIEGVVGSPKTINPLYAVNRDIDSDLSRLIYSSLFKYDIHGRLSHDLVETMEIGGENKEYIIKIREGVSWHTGGNLTAEDIVFTVNLIKSAEYNSPLRSAFTNITVEKIDDLTLKFVLAEPYAPFPDLLTFGILPANLWKNIAPNAAVLADLNLKPVGSGPYKFKSLVKSKTGDLKEYRLEANADYYGGQAYLKNITFIFFVDYIEAIKAFNDNQIMGLNYLPFTLRQEILAQNSVKFRELAQPQIISLFFNSAKNKTLADKDVRVALATALDKNQIIQEVFAGIHSPADGPILKESFAYNEEIKKYDYAPATAAETIKTKPVTAILTVIDSGNNVAVAEKVKDYWTKAGGQISLNIVSGDQAAEIVKNRNFEILLYGEFIGGDPDVFVFWHSSQAGERGFNLTGYNNPEADKLLAEARVSTDQAERISRYKKFQEIVVADLPAIFLYSPSYTYVQSNKLKGFSGTAIVDPGDRFSGVGGWYLKTKKKLTW
jgi:peptide/nickel transport system substrate-binding protein